MEKEYILEVANTIRQQIRANVGQNVMFSWGISAYRATIYDGKPALAMRVNGRLFKGDVVVAYNVLDYYEIHLINRKERRCICDEAYCDNLGDIIDRHIEAGDNHEEYMNFCENERKNLFSGNF
jgi:hypothetical protein